MTIHIGAEASVGRWQGKYVIGLTGNIAMGKSAIRKMLEHLGAYTIDADGLAHQVMAPGAPAYQPVVDWFGKWIVDPDGKINRAKLGAVAFSHPEALTKLETLTHPVVGQGIDTLVKRAQQPIVVIEAIKLIDGVLGEQVDTVWVVDTAPQVQLERLIKRGLPEADARKRIASQNAQRDKLAKADLIVANNGTLQDAWVQVEREWKKLLASRGLSTTQSDEVGTVNVARKSATQTTAVVPPPTGPVAPSIAAPKPSETKLATAPVSAPVAPPPAPVAPPTITEASPAAPVVARPAGDANSVAIKIRRGMPHTAEAIANLINQSTGRNLSRMDIMTSFGEKSYMLTEFDGKIVGTAGFTVDNLITRMDEFVIIPDAVQTQVAEALIVAVENASKELQSEVGFMYLPSTAPDSIAQVFLRLGYQKMELDQIKVPAWREAAEESQPSGTYIFAKRLRAERVLKPL